MDAETPYRFERPARTRRGALFVALWWGVIAVLYFAVNASPVICLVLGAFSLPALYDIGANTTAEIEINTRDIAWRSGRRGARLPRGQIKSVRLDTRLDLTLRMTLITHQGAKVRLPYECVPKAADIEAALTAQGIPYERHHFTLLS